MSTDTATVPPMPKGIDAEFAAELASRKAHVESLRNEADTAADEFHQWVLEQWLVHGKAAGNAVAEALGVSRTMLYRRRDAFLAEREQSES